MNFLRIVICALSITAFAYSACAECDRADEGTYVNSALNGKYNAAWVRASAAPKSTMNFEIMIPCGTKLIAATLYTTCSGTGIYSNLIIQSEGASQCSLGGNPKILIIGNKLQIRTAIRTPGFSGIYTFSREM